jgi:methylmalonyl-CoA mutase N-terminal domain/subunit
VVVGVNRYVETGAAVPRIGVFRLDPAIEARQVARLAAVRAGRPAGWRDALAAVTAAAHGSDNLVPPIVAAAEQQATLGEIADALRAVFGEHQDQVRL